MEWRTHIPCWLPEMRVWQTQYFFPRTRYLCYDKGGADVTIEDKMQPLSATRFCVAKHVLFELKPELFVELMRACP